MCKLFYLFKKAFTPLTIMVIPHEDVKSLNIKIPFIGLLILIILFAFGSFHIFSLAMRGLDYHAMEARANYYSRQFCEWNSTMSSLKKIEREFRGLLALGSKEKILESVDTSFSGEIDWRSLKQELEKTIERVDEIKDYLRTQKDIYMATPRGFPVKGNITSGYGKRGNLFSTNIFHDGVDISAKPGNPIRATADGMVIYSGRTRNSGYIIVLEHGCGFTTIYAHNKKNTVKIGQKVERGEIIAYVGSTGNSTGPHVHYEVWKDGKHVNPKKFLFASS